MNHPVAKLLGIESRVLAVIGTAGRREDGDKLTPRHWEAMVCAVGTVFRRERATALVSGGAAWADHAAVRIATDCNLPIQLWLPAVDRDMDTCRYYHLKFSAIIGRDTMREVDDCSPYWDRFGGFKDRNTKVANAADVFLAMTFGCKGRVKDGGTRDTVLKMFRRGVSGWHLDLSTFELHPAR